MKEYYKEIIDWSMVKEGDAIEMSNNFLCYFSYMKEDIIYFKVHKNQKISYMYKMDVFRPLDKSCIKREIDWIKVPVDTKLIVDNGGEKLKRYFSHFKNNTVYTFDKGQTSWSCAGYMRVDWRIDQVEIVDDNCVTEK